MNDKQRNMLRDALLKVSGKGFAAGQSAANGDDEVVQTAKAGEVAEAICEAISLVREFVSDAKEQASWNSLWDKSEESDEPETKAPTASFSFLTQEPDLYEDNKPC